LNPDGCRAHARSLRHGRANRHARTLDTMSARQILAEATDSTAFRRTNPVRTSRTWSIRLP
jgi:hypothetical protein